MFKMYSTGQIGVIRAGIASLASFSVLEMETTLRHPASNVRFLNWTLAEGLTRLRSYPLHESTSVRSYNGTPETLGSFVCCCFADHRVRGQGHDWTPSVLGPKLATDWSTGRLHEPSEERTESVMGLDRSLGRIPVAVHPRQTTSSLRNKEVRPPCSTPIKQQEERVFFERGMTDGTA